MNSSRRSFLALAVGSAAAFAGCLSDGDGGSPASSDDGGGDDGGSGDGGGDGGGSGDGDGGSENGGDTGDAGDGSAAADLPTQESVVPLSNDLEAYDENAVSGGVPKDGIPSIDDPQFGGPEEGDAQMEPGDIVFGVEIDGDVRAYPQRILVSHEIVNDTVGGKNVAVTYCPLTGTAIGFERGGVEFGVSGRLVNNNLIMYDRATDSWWPQVLGTAVNGQMKGKSLHEFPVVWTTWGRWRETHPETRVMKEDTGSIRDYERDPYGEYNPRGGYYDSGSTLFPNMTTDERYHPKAVVLGARTADGTVAFEKDALRESSVREATVGGVPYVAVYDRALDFGWVYRNTDEVSLQATDEGYTGPDGETHPADDLPLERVNAFDAMWFTWPAYYPETVVV